MMPHQKKKKFFLKKVKKSGGPDAVVFHHNGSKKAGPIGWGAGLEVSGIVTVYFSINFFPLWMTTPW